MTEPESSTPGARARPTMLQSLVAVVALPVVVAIAVPLVIARRTHVTGAFAKAGLFELVLGIAAVAWCVREFHVTGRGTIAPWAPPTTLASGGLYQWSRNPMYIGVLLIVTGWALGFNSAALWAYTACLAVAFHLRVILGEEPRLARTFGDEWTAYRKRVPRWLL